jgi:type I restriction enzyme R subunit
MAEMYGCASIHATDNIELLEPYAAAIEDRYAAWVAAQEEAGVSFTSEQHRWLDVMRNHVATALRVGLEGSENSPFDQSGDLGRIHRVFGDRLPGLLDELNKRLAA